MTSDGDAALYDFAARPAARLWILVLKLDHLGDFIIGLPSLRLLRAAFPTAFIRLIVGSWNEAQAVAAGLADDVASYDFFPRDAPWDGSPYEVIEKFRFVAAGHYDIAIDLRVDEDTRHLLREADADLRCGIGARARYPYLDIALPHEHALRDNFASTGGQHFIAPARFTSHMPFKHEIFHETDFRPVESHQIFGPHITLPLGRFVAFFDLQSIGATSGLGKIRVTIDIARDAEEVALRRLHLRELTARHGVSLGFENDSLAARYEFRIHISGKPFWGRLRFGGVHLVQPEAAAPARLQRATLHIGEQLALLVQLVAARTNPLYPQNLIARPAGIKNIAIAPFSNSSLRDWPFAHYVGLVRRFLERKDCKITLLGSPRQAERLGQLACEAGAGLPDAGAKISNLGGATEWSALPELLRAVDLVICNNSGIAHLAAASGARTLAIYAGSHQPQEWGPRGQHSRAIMAVVPCSPCGHDKLADCAYEHRCMRGLTPETIYEQACNLLAAT